MGWCGSDAQACRGSRGETQRRISEREAGARAPRWHSQGRPGEAPGGGCLPQAVALLLLAGCYRPCSESLRLGSARATPMLPVSVTEGLGQHGRLRFRAPGSDARRVHLAMPGRCRLQCVRVDGRRRRLPVLPRGHQRELHCDGAARGRPRRRPRGAAVQPRGFRCGPAVRGEPPVRGACGGRPAGLPDGFRWLCPREPLCLPGGAWRRPVVGARRLELLKVVLAGAAGGTPHADVAVQPRDVVHLRRGDLLHRAGLRLHLLFQGPRGERVRTRGDERLHHRSPLRQDRGNHVWAAWAHGEDLSHDLAVQQIDAEA